MQLGKLVGIGFVGAATLSGKHNGVHAEPTESSPYALYMHYHCHLLQVTCIQTANHTVGIKHVYTTLT